MPGGHFAVGAVEPVKYFLRDTLAVILHAQHECAVLLTRGELHIAVVHVRDAVDYRVFHKRLGYQLRHDAVLEALVHIRLPREAVLKAQRLDIEVLFQQLKLLFERYKAIPGYPRAKKRGKVRRHRGDLRDMVRHAEPLHAVERVIQKMRVELRLHHG